MLASVTYSKGQFRFLKESCKRNVARNWQSRVGFGQAGGRDREGDWGKRKAEGRRRCRVMLYLKNSDRRLIVHLQNKLSPPFHDEHRFTDVRGSQMYEKWKSQMYETCSGFPRPS